MVRAMPWSTRTTLGLVPSSQPPLFFRENLLYPLRWYRAGIEGLANVRNNWHRTPEKKAIMEPWQTEFWQMRLESCKKALAQNNFEVFLARDCAEARAIFNHTLLPALEVRSASWADSMSLHATGILDDLKNNPAIDLIETFAPGVPREELIERRRQALLVDLFLTGTNALTDSGELVNLDMIGNRVGAIAFGPRTVVLVIGRNKLVRNVEEGMARIKTYAAPMNALRHTGWKMPCVKTSFCMDCRSPDRICNTWTITRKSYPKGRVKILLINEDLGL